MLGCQCDDQLWGSGCGAIAGCSWRPTQQWHAEKTSRKAALSFLQKLRCSLRKNRFLLFGVYAGIIVLFLLVLLLVVLLLVVLLLVVLHLVVVLLVVLLLGCSGRGAIVVCYGGGEGRVKTNFGGVDVVPLLGMVRGAIAGCHCSVLWWRGGWLGERPWCHCRVPL